MRSIYGAAGYGWFWMIIEMLRESNDYQIDMRSKYVWNAFAMQTQSDAETIKKFILDCIHEFELFESDDAYFWSPSLSRRMENRDEKSRKASESAQKRWKKCDSDANAMRTHSEGNALKEKKEKESKRKESKDLKDLKNSSEGSDVSSEPIQPSTQMEYFEPISNDSPANADAQNVVSIVSDAIETKVPDESVVYLTGLLIQRMQENNPKAKVPNQLSKWHLEMERIIRLDQYSVQDIRDVIEWCQRDAFWKSNILSPGKLREKMPTMVLQMKNRKPPDKKSAFHVIQDMYRELEESESDGPERSAQAYRYL